MQAPDKRKARRRPLRYSAWMTLDDDKLHGCVLSDISDTGARLDVEDSQSLPEQFMLLLSGRGSAKRKCRIIWRSPGQIGVAFERHLNEVAAKPPATRHSPDTKPAAVAAKTAVEPAESA